MAIGALFGLIVWLVVSIVIATAASQRGRSGLAWFLFSIFLSPLIAGFCLLLFPPIRDLGTDRIPTSDDVLYGYSESTPRRRMGGGWLLLFSAILAFAAIFVLTRVPYLSDAFNAYMLMIAGGVVILLVTAAWR